MNQISLFTQGLVPWTEPKSTLDDEIAVERDRLLAELAELADSHLGRIEAKVAFLLQRFPETRDSDVALAIRYWRKFDAYKLAAWRTVELEVLYELENFESLSRARRRIQNTYGLFPGTRITRTNRDELQMEFFEYAAAARTQEPVIRLYLDETGNDPSQRLVGVGGICIPDWRLYSKFHAAFARWRSKTLSPDTLHFAGISESTESKYLQFIREFLKYRAGVLFVGYAVDDRSIGPRSLVSLFAHLIADSVAHLRDRGVFKDIRAVEVIKEAETQFDDRYLETLRKEVHHLLQEQSGETVYLRDIRPMPKGSDVLLELADLVAASSRRTLVSTNHIHKDRVADAMVNVAEFRDEASNGALFRWFPEKP